MSSKTVKVTSGKVLNYKISASGYKTIYGSKVVTANSTINHTLVPESSSNGVYSLGDRIGNMASFVGYFNSINPDTQVAQKYAVFVLDAAYRGKRYWARNSSIPGSSVPLPEYNNSENALNSTESATYNTDLMYNTFSSSQLADSSFELCRNVSVVLDGITYYGQMPNLKELTLIAGESGDSGLAHRQFLDNLDPTLTSYPNNSLVSLNMENNSSGRVFASTWYSGYSGNTWCLIKGNYNIISFEYIAYYGQYGVIPVFEIPVE